MSKLTYNEYWKEIKSIADNLVDETMNEAIQDYDGDNPGFEEMKEIASETINDSRLHETIDGHQWVIYYAYNLDVIDNSENEDYYADNMGDFSSFDNLNSLHTAVAYYAMYADVNDSLDTAFDDYENNVEAS